MGERQVRYRVYVPGGVATMERLTVGAGRRIAPEIEPYTAPTKLEAVNKFVAWMEQEIAERQRWIEDARALVQPHWEGVTQEQAPNGEGERGEDG